MGSVYDLVERSVTFDYGYNMRCAECPGITPLTAAEYFSEPNGAHVDCANCGHDIHFGPAVMTLRDADDPVLDDQQAGRVAWYHTSTVPDWPQPPVRCRRQRCSS
jgi:Zn ribbon nucleic-acid-binding protein